MNQLQYTNLEQNKKNIYMDHAATGGYKPEEVKNAVLHALSYPANPGRGSYKLSLDAARIVYEARVRLAALFKADHPSCIAFTANATQALNTAIYGSFGSGDHVITTALEHNSVLRPLYRMENQGIISLSIIPADATGCIHYEDFEKNLRENTAGVVCTHASNLTGNIIDIGKIGEFCMNHNLRFIVDASQSAGILDIDMQKTGIDILCVTGHKSLMGPQGTGAICVREGLKTNPLIVGGSGIKSFSREHPNDMPAALEAGTLNTVGIAGLEAALAYIEKTGMERMREKEQELLWRMYHGFKKINGVNIYGNFEESAGSSSLRIPIIAVNIGGEDAGKIADMLFENYGICVRAGTHCAPLMHTALGTQKQGAVRFSLSWFNTPDEVDMAIDALAEIAGEKSV